MRCEKTEQTGCVSYAAVPGEQSALDAYNKSGVRSSPGEEKQVVDANIASYRMSCFRFRWMIMSCTELIVILRRLVSVAFVKCP